MWWDLKTEEDKISKCGRIELDRSAVHFELSRHTIVYDAELAVYCGLPRKVGVVPSVEVLCLSSQVQVARSDTDLTGKT